MSIRVLVTGGTGVVGAAVCRELVRIGAEPIALSRVAPKGLPDGVSFLAGDVTKPDEIAEAASGCGAVIHLAWETSEGASAHQRENTNTVGTANVLDAMDHAGCRRIVFLSSTEVYGSAERHPTPFLEDEPVAPLESCVDAVQKTEAERLINSHSGIEAVIARSPMVLGRGVDSVASRAYAGRVLPDIDGSSVIQAIHQEDVARFLSQAAVGDQAGTVNLAASDSISVSSAGTLLGRRVIKLPRAMASRIGPRLGVPGLDSGRVNMMASWPVADTSALHEQWNFEPLWSHEELFRDHARSASRSTFSAADSAPRLHKRCTPWVSSGMLPRSAYAPDTGWQPASAPEFEGSLDSMVDPRYPLFSDTNLGEAFPGPLTPLSLDLALDGMAATAEGLLVLLGIDGELADPMRTGIGAYGHRMYVNVSLLHELSKALPGPGSQEDIDRMYLGVESDSESETEATKISAREAAEGARIGSRIAPRLAGFGAAVERTGDEATRLLEVDVANLTDDQLVSHIRLAHDLLCQSWVVTATGNILLTAFAASILEDDTSQESNSAGATTTLRINDLAALIRSDARLAEAMGDQTITASHLQSLVADFPALATMVTRVVAECGHRGVGECELANLVFSDQPENLVDIARRAAQLPASETEGPQLKRSRAERFARKILENKESARNNVVRTLHSVRLAVRERGQRWCNEGLLHDPDDIFYLSYEEVLRPTPVTQDEVAKRRAERQRLATYQMPHTFDRQWTPQTESASSADSGDVLTGIAAVAGVYEGVVRVLAHPMEDFDPGDILVTEVTDIGWTSLFPIAGAVVTDVGGVASHAAIVAREFGLPAVVGVTDATLRLQTGTIVRVNGDDGTVAVLSTESSTAGS